MDFRNSKNSDKYFYFNSKNTLLKVSIWIVFTFLIK